MNKVILWTIIIALLIIGGIFGALFSVTNSPTLVACQETYGSEKCDYGNVWFGDYDIHVSHANTYEVNDVSWKTGYATPNAGCTCGSINDGGVVSKFGIGRTLSTGAWCGCPKGTAYYPILFSDGVILATGIIGEGSPNKTFYEQSDLVIDTCSTLGTKTYCNIRVDIPVDKINMSYDSTQLITFVGQDVQLPLVLTNGWSKALQGDLFIDYAVNTPFGNITKSEEISNFDFPVGEKTIDVTIPTENVADILYFKARFKASLIEGVHFGGFHVGKCNNPPQPIVENIEVRTIETGWQKIVINPKPLYLEVPSAGCDSLEGYDLNADKTFCIRDDLAELSCMQIGCPTFANMTNDYVCTSAGICAETVYEYGCVNDSDCEDFGAVCLESAFSEEEKFCVKTEIKEIIKEIPQPVYIQQTCAEINYCADGYDCIDDELDDGTKMAVCVRNTSFVPGWVYVVGILAIIVIIGAVIYSIKKK